MHGGRAGGDGKQGAGGGKKGMVTTNCDAEHEEHEALVKHFEVGISWISERGIQLFNINWFIVREEDIKSLCQVFALSMKNLTK